jgi:endoglucanase
VKRRDLLRFGALSTAQGLPAARRGATELPRWRGFNLQEKFTHTPDEWAGVDPEWGRRNEPFRESDFEQIATLGFNFVRLPMSYRCWADPSAPYQLFEPTLREIDQAVNWGRQYGIHVSLNFHRAPGYCINSSLLAEPWNLWTDAAALDIFTFHWTQFALRYKGIPGASLSFNLVNEPNACTPAQYARVAEWTAKAIREIDADRLVVVDGMFSEIAQPVPELARLPNAIHSARGYAPFKLSHYLAPWSAGGNALPTWPTKLGDLDEWDRDRLDQFTVLPWQGLEGRGARVFVGEWGCWNRTPCEVALAWMRDYLSLWKSARWGWALWCFRGSFGILDSGRTDVRYENWRGHQLDREMLELLQAF